MDATSDEYKNFIRAIENGNLEQVKSLIQIVTPSVFKEYHTNAGDSMLHFAAQRGQVEIVELFLNYFDVNSKAANAHYKIFGGNKEIAKTPLMCAIDGGNFETVKLLMDRGASLQVPSLTDYHTPLINAAVRGHERVVKLLLDSGIIGCPVNSLEALDRPDDYYENVRILRQMLIYGHCDVMETILNFNSIALGSSLETVIFQGKSDKIAILIDCAKKRLDKVDVKGIMSKCLRDVAFTGDKQKVKLLLLDYGANVNHLCAYRGTPLYSAISGAKKEIVQILLDKGADVNAPMKNRTSLFRHRRSDVVDKHESFEISMIIVRHIVDLLGKGMYVRPDHLVDIDSDDKLKCFKKSCEEEMKLIKGQKFDDCFVSLYDVWKADLIQLTSYLKNEKIANFVTSREFSTKFTIYLEQMEKKFNKGFKRIYFQRQICNFFSSLSTRKDNRLPKLPATCVHQIINQLTNKDLSNLRQSYF